MSGRDVKFEYSSSYCFLINSPRFSGVRIRCRGSWRVNFPKMWYAGKLRTPMNVFWMSACVWNDFSTLFSRLRPFLVSSETYRTHVLNFNQEQSVTVGTYNEVGRKLTGVRILRSSFMACLPSSIKELNFYSSRREKKLLFFGYERA